MRRFGGTTYANVVSTIALVMAVGGTSAYAAVTITGADIKPRSITAQNLATGSVTARAVKRGSLLASDFKPGQSPRGATGMEGAKGATGPQGAVGPQGNAGPQGAIGPKGDTGPAGSARAWGQVNADGTLVLARSSDNVTVKESDSAGIYCITLGGGINSATTTVIATPGFDASHPDTSVQVDVPNDTFPNQCAASDFVVLTYPSGSNVFGAEPFTFVVP